MAKKSKLSGAAKYKSTYRKEWATKYNWLSSIRGDKSSFRCNVCAKNVSCAHQGETDVTRHMNTKAHQALATALVKQPTLNMKQANPLAEKITRAEVKMVMCSTHSSQCTFSNGRYIESFDGRYFPRFRQCKGVCLSTHQLAPRQRAS